MMRLFCLLTAIVFAGSAFAQPLLVNTRLHNYEAIAPGNTFTLDLREYFQRYEEPGPVATLRLHMPVQAGERELFQQTRLTPAGNQLINDGPRVRIMTYELADGSTYQHAYEVTSASLFRWETVEIPFQLIPKEAPVTVANFMTYARDGDYRNTIVHRNESTGTVFRPNGMSTFAPLPIIQSGGFRISDSEKFLSIITSRGPIVRESTRDNTVGTIAMARTANPDSATSEFFINLADNRSLFGSAYAVFGYLVDEAGSLPQLARFANTSIFDLTPWYTGLPFQTVPLYTPYWNDKWSYTRFSSIDVPAGNPDGVTYAWEYAFQPEQLSDEEAANRAAFQINIVDNQLQIQAVDTGFLDIVVKGSFSGSADASFKMRLVAFNPDAINQFPEASIRQFGWMNTFWYGWVNAGYTYPYVFHMNHGWQYFSEASNPSVIYVWDEELDSWLYSTKFVYPSLFHYASGRWMWYMRETGSGSGEERQPRWFYVYDDAYEGGGFWATEADPRI